MKVKLSAASIALLVLGLGSLHSQEIQEVGSFALEGKLNLDYYYHKLGDNWTARHAGYKGINYNYSFNAATPTSPSGNGVFGETLLFTVGMRPTENLSGIFGFEVINDYADRFWVPVNFEHRLKLDGQRFFWNTGDINYKYGGANLRYFRGVGHYNWKYEGDLFGLYMEQFETGRYLRVSGRPIPEGFEFKTKSGTSKLQLIYGPEVIWDYRNGLYANYNFMLGRFDSNLIYRDHIIPYGEPDERMRSVELSTKYKFSKNSQAGIGVMYQPFRLNRDYIYVEDVGSGAGLTGSSFLKKTGTTSSRDAFGVSTKLTLNPRMVFSNMIFQYTYAGLAAGNKQEVETQFFRTLSRFVTGSIEYKYRKPLIGPLPLVREGTSGNAGPAIFEPRGPESPFWVGWGNKAAGWDNREASILSVVFTYDPTPDTWFYRYEPNVGEEWNLNPEEDAPVSFSTRYTLTKYFSATDRLLYWDENGHTVWEPPTVTGAWATKDYVGAFSVIGKISLPEWRLIFDVGAGDSLATGSFAYTASTDTGKPVTGYITTGISASTGRYHLGLRYSQNDWGPEEWHRQFGETFDKLYQVSISRDFNDSVTAGIGYVGAREDDNKYFAVELGDYDEFRAFATISFGPVRMFLSREKSEPQKDTTPPQASLTLSTNTFSPDGDGVDDTLDIFPLASDFSGIARWKIVILEMNGKAVKTIEGNDVPPASVLWDGKDDFYEKVVPQGTYQVRLSATDPAGNEGVSETLDVSVSFPPRVVVKEIVKEVSKEIRVEETSRGLLVSMTSRVLFDVGKSALKPAGESMLGEILKVVNAYPDNKIAVEGHTDNTGSKELNQKLSGKRAGSVADYLIRHGVAAERIKAAGLGKDKPITDNSTAQGREANRRVEVIILKE
jgi:outer membrane protein OmpA-like peptidoglycan-associated protein